MVHPVLLPRRSQSEIDINDRDHIRAALTQKTDLQTGSPEVGEFYTATGADGMRTFKIINFIEDYLPHQNTDIYIWMYLVQNR